MSIQKLKDNELVQLFINGNEDCLAILLDRHKKKIFSCIMVVIKDQALAEDIFQDTFFKVIQTLKRGQYNEEGKFVPWVIRISRNLIIDHFRRIKKMPPMPVYLNDDGDEISVFRNIAAEDNTESNAYQIHLKKSIRGLISELDDEQREVVIMRIYYDMSFKEISELTKVSINTSLGRMRYALFNLKKMIEEKNMSLSLR